MNEKLMKLTQSLHKNGEVTFQFKKFSVKTSNYLFQIVSLILSSKELSFLQHVIFTLLREIINNAVKANLKRIYFLEKDANIFDEGKYIELMQSFKKEVINRKDFYDKVADKHDYKVKCNFKVQDDFIIFKIVNNNKITNTELTRINERIVAATETDQISEVLGLASDDTEGSGLGLILNLMLLKSTGIGVKNFEIENTDEYFSVELRVPTTIHLPRVIAKVKNEIINELETVPTFPQSIIKVVELCDSKDSSMTQISEEIEKDPALASNILKLANSSSFATTEPADTIQKAATKLGISGIRDLTVTISAKKVLDHKYKEFTSFWDHANLCAKYCRVIAIHVGLKKEADTLYLAGLLHDIGRLILYSVEPTATNNIDKLMVNKNKANSTLFEEISMGISHTQIGGKLAQKWNFTELLHDCIRYHHFPQSAKPQHQKAAAIVHLADSFISIEKKSSSYVYVDLYAREILGLNEKQKCEQLHKLILQV